MKLKIDNVGEYLKSHDIKPSYQRMKIFEFLLKNPIHPTVDDIYKELINEIPTLSKTTIYNTLNLFIEREIALLITIEENETRYDANTMVHGHFKCEKCEKVFDFETDIEKISSNEIDDFQVNQRHIYFKGICRDCLKMEG